MLEKATETAAEIPLFRIYSDEEDVERVKGVLTRGSYWATGKEIEQFEERLLQYVGAKYCVTFNSGTSALHAALLAYGIKEGDEIIVPSFTFIATANAPLFVGAKPVFADIELETYGLDPEDVERKISPRTRAIIPVHYGGCPCRILELRRIARDHGLLLLEDAAEALGAEVHGVKVGNFGDAAVLSFCQNKVISTGEGGAVITNSGEIYNKLKLVRSHGRLETANYFATSEYLDYIALGYNFRMPTMCAALGLAQLGKVEKLIEMRRENARYLTERLAAVAGLLTPSEPPGCRHVYQMYTVRVTGGARDGLMKWLEGRGIGTKVFFPPVHSTSFYRSLFDKAPSLPLTEKISGEVLTLPMFPTISHGEMDRVVAEVGRFFSSKTCTAN